MMGIYSITNILTGHRNIGQTTNLARRWREHKGLLKRQEHFNNHLQAHWNKYGPDAFIYDHLVSAEYLDGYALTELEQGWVDHFRAIGVKLYNQKEPAPRARWSERVERSCAECGKLMLLAPYAVKDNRTFCSRKCAKRLGGLKRRTANRTEEQRAKACDVSRRHNQRKKDGVARPRKTIVWPPLETLSQMIRDLGTKAVCKQLDVAKSTLSEHLTSLGARISDFSGRKPFSKNKIVLPPLDELKDLLRRFGLLGTAKRLGLTKPALWTTLRRRYGIRSSEITSE